MRQFRLRRGTEILGPLNEVEIREYFNKQRFLEKWEIQVFPNGLWEELEQFYHGNQEGLEAFDYSPVPELPEEQLDKTKVIRMQELNLDKTVINKNFQKKYPRKEEEEKKIPKTDAKDTPTQVLSYEDATQIIKIDKYLPALRKDIEKFDDQSLEEYQELQHPLVTNKTNGRLRDYEDQKVPEQKEDKKPKKVLIVLLSIILVFLFLDDETPVEKKNSKGIFDYPEIVFPFEYEKPSPGNSIKLLKEGRDILKNESYTNKLSATKKLFSAVENDFKNKEAFGLLLYLYSDLLPDAKNKQISAGIIFKLFELAKGTSISELEFVTSRALYFYGLGRDAAAIKTIEDFRAIGKPSTDLYSIYLLATLRMGDFEKAGKIADSLKKAPENLWGPRSFLAYAEFLILNESFAEAEGLLEKGVGQFSNRLDLQIKLGEVFFKLRNIKRLEEILENIEKNNFEKRREILRQFLKLKGLVFALTNKPKEATEYLQKSLQLGEDSSLRNSLSTLSLEGDGESSQLIKESKIYLKIQNSKKYLKEKRFEAALTEAVSAKNIDENYLLALLNLSQVQTELGFLDDAIKNLENAFKLHPNSPEVLFALFRAYSDSYRIRDSQKIIQQIRSLEFDTDIRFSKLMGSFFLRTNDRIGAIKWFQASIQRNPVDDESYFLLGKTFQQFNKFNQSRKFMLRAIDLDPSQTNYRVGFANIVYEIDGVNAAIGYLRDNLVEFPESGEILGAIGIYYYRSGQLKSFEEIKEQLEKTSEDSDSLYEFLFRSSILDDRVEEVVRYGKRLIELRPGDIELKMELGKMLIEFKQFKDAVEVFGEVSKRVKDYPRINYYRGLLYYYLGKKDKALEQAKVEIEKNPGVVESFELAGEIERENGNFVEAMKYFSEVQRIDSRSLKAFIGIAKIKFALNQHEAAIDLYKRAINIKPNDPQLHLELAVVYRQLGMGALAADSYKVYLDLDPESAQKAEILNYIKILKKE